VVESPGGDSSNSGGGGIGSNSRGNSDNYASGGLTIDGSMTPPESQIYTAANMGQWSSPVRSSEGGGRPLEGRGFASHSPKLRTRSDAEEANSGKIGRISPPYSGSNTGSISPPVVFREGLAEKEDRLRAASAWGHMPGWRMLPCFIKSNDDLRQEQLASQLIREMANVLSSAKVPVWLYPYQIIAISDRAGIIEAVSDSISIDSLKRNYPGYTSLSNFFVEHFGPPGSDCHAGAKANFVESMAAYSVVCYLLQVKDRHNGNILLTKDGHIVHIDFGFFFLSSPGKGMGFESAPFKLTREAVDMMDGPNSRTFMRFRDLCGRTFMQLRKNAHKIILLVEMLVGGNEDLMCFAGNPDRALSELTERFKLDMNDAAVREYVDTLVDESLENWRTRWYDRYQRCCTGVL
jgi:phosphatidylinositol 4-kinase